MFANKAVTRLKSRKARHVRIRRKVAGTGEIPRLCVRRSLKNIYLQLVDDTTGRSLLQISSLSSEVKDAIQGKKKVEISREMGLVFAKKAKEAGVTRVVFDRGGYLYHGRVQAVADAAREGGLVF